MTQILADRAVRFWCHTALSLFAATTLVTTGCRSRQRRPGLLGPRAIIPAPYVAPGGTTTAGTTPADTFGPAPMDTTSGMGTGLVQPADFPDVTPIEGDTTPPALPPFDEEQDSGVVLPPNVPSQNLTYTVDKGDSLWRIGQLYGVTVAELAAENNIDPDKTLHPGDVLRLPPGARRRDPSEIKTPKRTDTPARPSTPRNSASSSVAKQPIPSSGRYTVKAGDNLWTISRRFGVSSQDIIAWNDLNTDVLQIGQELRLRKTGSGTATRVPERTRPPTRTTVEQPEETDTQPEPRETTTAEDRNTGYTQPDDAETEVEEREEGTGAVPGALDMLPRKLDHTVTEGETLQIIADMYGTTVQAIKEANPSVKSDADLEPNLKIMVPYR